MKRILIVVITVVCLLLMSSCGSTEPSAADNADVTIKTPYCKLAVSEDFAKNVKDVVSAEEPYTVTFRMRSDDTELFSVVFGGETEDLLGTLVLEEENIVLYARVNELDSADADYETYRMYQDGLSTIIQNLSSDYDFVMNEIIVKEDTSTFDIKTSVVTLKYPNKWKDKVTVDVADETVKFSCNGEKLFDLYFTECDGYLLGTYKDTPIYIVDYPLDKGKLSEDELFELSAMQQDVNIIIRYLSEDGNFKLSE